MLATLDGQHKFIFTVGTFQAENDLLGGLGLLPENRLRLSTISSLFAIITSAALAAWRLLSFLVLAYLVEGVLAALARTERLPGLGDVDHLVGFW